MSTDSAKPAMTAMTVLAALGLKRAVRLICVGRQDTKRDGHMLSGVLGVGDSHMTQSHVWEVFASPTGTSSQATRGEPQRQSIARRNGNLGAVGTTFPRKHRRRSAKPPALRS